MSWVFLVLGPWTYQRLGGQVLPPGDTVEHRYFFLRGDSVYVTMAVMPKPRRSCLFTTYQPVSPPQAFLLSAKGDTVAKPLLRDLDLRFASRGGQFNLLRTSIPADMVYILKLINTSQDTVRYSMSIRRVPAGKEKFKPRKAVKPVPYTYSSAGLDTTTAIVLGALAASCCLLLLPLY